MHFNKIGYKEHVIFPINLHHKSRNGLPWRMGNPPEDWMDNREGKANPALVFRHFHNWILGTFLPLVIFSLYLGPARWILVDQPAVS